MTGVERIVAERLRQIEVEGWTPEHDFQYTEEELLNAATVYVLSDEYTTFGGISGIWPWDRAWFKPATKIRNLEKAGALIAAEIDRLLWQQSKQ